MANKTSGIALFSVVTLAGCANLQQMSGSDYLDCALTTMAGAGVGALASGGNTGAIVGGAAAGALGCLVYKHETIRTRTAEQVEDEYKQANKALPEKTTVTAYKAKLSPTAVVAKGTSATVVSEFTVLEGNAETPSKVEEELVLLDPSGAKRSSARKPVETDGSGAYKNQFSFKMPAGVPDGIYPLNMALYVDDELVKSSSLKMQVIASGTADARTILIASGNQ